MHKCTILIGVPAAGKSTWLDSNFRNMEAGSVVASTDNIIQEIADRYGFTYNEVFKDAFMIADKVMAKRLAEAAERGVDIYVDRTNLSEKSRRQFINKLKKYDYTFDAVDFETPEKEEWERRLNNRPGKNIPSEVLIRMLDSYEMPLKSEGFENITFIKNNV